jgi:hypothetical protein
MRLKINHRDNIFEWIPYDHFNEIKKIHKGESATAIWNEGPLCHDYYEEKWTRISNKQATLKCHIIYKILLMNF